MPEEIPVVKAGFKTTEFWLSAVAVIAGLLTASGLFPDTSIWAKIAGLVVSSLTAMGYTATRGAVKTQ